METIVLVETKGGGLTGEVFATTDVTVGAVERDFNEGDEGYQNDVFGAPGVVSIIGEQDTPSDDLVDQIQSVWEQFQNGPDEPVDGCDCSDEED